jgi:hypothetical protein
MWCAIAMPPYGGFFMAVNPLQKHIFRGALKAISGKKCKKPMASPR